MKIRASDLSIQELSALGAAAAREASTRSLAAGLVVTGTIESHSGQQRMSHLAWMNPNGAVTLIEDPLIKPTGSHHYVDVLDQREMAASGSKPKEK